MTSDDLRCLAARLAGYAMAGRAVEPEHAAVIARALLGHAQVTAALEKLPFDVMALPAEPLLDLMENPREGGG